MKLSLVNTRFLILSMTVFFIIGCSKKSAPPSTPPEQLPQPYTDNIDSLSATSFQVFGGLYSNGGQHVTEAGFCWSTDSLPTVADSHIQLQLIANFYVTITGLTENTKYHVRAYAKNSAGLAYGNSVAVTTRTLKPIVHTKDISAVSSDYAFIDGEVIDPGNAPVTRFGICWSTNTNPTVNNDTTISSPDPTDFFGELDNLKVNTTYYARAYATNQYGTGYGDTVSFMTAYYIGEVFGGGKIVYIDGTKIHGLIVANTDQGSTSWDSHSVASWTYASDLNNGASNTTKIINSLGSAYCAASLCRNYTGGGYTDWFMPARNQLHYLFDAKDKIGNVTPGYYWSSTENSNDISSAWVVRMDTQNGSEEVWTKNYSYVVRAMRAF